MKFAFQVGGCAGFLVVAATGYLADRAMDLVLRDAAIGCLIGALLFRWFWTVLVKAFDQTLYAKRLAEAEAAAHAAAEKATPVTPVKSR